MIPQKPVTAYEAGVLQQFGFLMTEYNAHVKELYTVHIAKLENNLKTCQQFQAEQIGSELETYKHLLGQLP
jgi:hypothetical protein